MTTRIKDAFICCFIELSYLGIFRAHRGTPKLSFKISRMYTLNGINFINPSLLQLAFGERMDSAGPEHVYELAMHLDILNSR